jgi:hypothetical protein
MMNRLGRIARTIEFTVAGLLTLEVLVLHFNVMRHAGPLWRDEISSLRVATMPTWGGLWSSLVYDPVPVLFFGILRLWNWLFAGATDESLRYLGFLVGFGIVGAIWLTAWIIKKAPPTWAMLLFGLSPVALVWGDSMRAYGIGCFFNILAVGLISKLLRDRPRPGDIALVLGAALCSVHSLFPNAILLFAILAGASAVTIYRRWWRTLFILQGVGFAAAVSLLPYAGIIRQTQSWSGLCKAGIDSSWIFTMLFRATESGGDLASIFWITGAALACIALLLLIVNPLFLLREGSNRNLVIYAGVTLVVAITTTVGFLRWVGWTTSLWYYLPLMATAVVCIDGMSQILRKTSFAIIGNSLLIVIAAATLSPLAFRATNVRLTNVDLTTAAIAQRAQPSDLIVVDNYFYAISFHRYYKGKAPWVSVPDVTDFSLHRWDLLTETMRRPQPIQPILDRIDQTLKAGHEVYVVGFAPLDRGPSAPPDLAVAPKRSSGWSLWPYVRRWTTQIAYAVQTRAEHGKIISVKCGQPISTVENVHAVVVSGWKDNTVAALP